MSVNIYLLSEPRLTEEHQQFLDSVGLTWHRPDPATAAESIVEFSGRLCYMSFGSKQSPRSNEEYVANLIAQGHESVLEHASWTFLITGVSRAFSHQLVRHRVGFSYSQLSQQYHDETDASFTRPIGIEFSDEVTAIWDEAIAEARGAYKKLIQKLDAPSISSNKEKLRAIRSAARSVLPAATETSLVVTANARALRHFLFVRGSIVGDGEMRMVSHMLLEILSKQAPALFADFESNMIDDGLPLVTRRTTI